MKSGPQAPPEDRWALPAAAARVLVGAVFVVSGFEKAVHPPQEFAAVMEAYYILPDPWLLPLAAALPWAELLLGAYLAAGYKTRTAAAALGAMLALFFGALLSTRLRGVPLEHCGCFGSALALTPVQAMLFDGTLIALASLAYARGRGLWSLDDWVEAGS